MDNDTIRKAVSLADDLAWWDDLQGNSFIDYMDGATVLRTFAPDSQIILDYLAAQLVRQVDALEDLHVSIIPAGSEVWLQVWAHEPTGSVKRREAVRCIGSATGDDRTMNTIKAIVDSGVLE